uniref:Uncharacterized protein n=1 Tax=Aegilops tauschii TaxID=37682 RepID=N1QTB0_AEGTA
MELRGLIIQLRPSTEVASCGGTGAAKAQPDAPEGDGWPAVSFMSSYGFNAFVKEEAALAASTAGGPTFVLDTSEAPDNPSSHIGYGLTRRGADADAEADATEPGKTQSSKESEKKSTSPARDGGSSGDLMLRRYKEDMASLPDHRGIDEFEEVPVEGFGAALLAGYGWSEGKGLGRNNKEDTKVVEYNRRAATAGPKETAATSGEAAADLGGVRRGGGGSGRRVGGAGRCGLASQEGTGAGELLRGLAVVGGQGSLELLLFAEEGEEVVVAAGAAAGHLSCWVLLLARGCELLPIAEGKGNFMLIAQIEGKISRLHQGDTGTSKGKEVDEAAYGDFAHWASTDEELDHLHPVHDGRSVHGDTTRFWYFRDHGEENPEILEGDSG